VKDKTTETYVPDERLERELLAGLADALDARGRDDFRGFDTLSVWCMIRCQDSERLTVALEALLPGKRRMTEAYYRRIRCVLQSMADRGLFTYGPGGPGLGFDRGWWYLLADVPSKRAGASGAKTGSVTPITNFGIAKFSRVGESS
jgi:hypothetical protein